MTGSETALGAILDVPRHGGQGDCPCSCGHAGFTRTALWASVESWALEAVFWFSATSVYVPSRSGFSHEGRHVMLPD